MRNLENVVIVGAGQAAAHFAVSLRKDGYQGDITLIGDENDLPYERPQLSKDVLLNCSDEIKWIKTHEEYSALNIKLRLGDSVQKVNPNDSSLILATGEKLGFGTLVLAMGVRARQLFDDQPENFISLRNIQDALNLKSKLIQDNQVVIIGGGVIGLEVASAAVQKGCQVKVIETTSQLMGRVLDDASSQFIQKFHENQNIDFLFGTSVHQILPNNQIALSNGQIITADLVVLGVGVVPNNQCIEHLEISHPLGVLVDSHSQTTFPNIFAIGDIAVQTDDSGQKYRIETWQNALDQAIRLSSFLTKNHQIEAKKNWFWSDQSSLNLQVVGTVKSANRIDRKISSDQLTHFYFDENQKLIGCLAFNNPKDMVFARRYVESNQKFDFGKLKDSQFTLKECLLG